VIYKDSLFPPLDTALRRGAHIDPQSDPQGYQLLCENHAELRTFYAGYRCTLKHHPDGVFFLVPDSKDSVLKTRVLPASCAHIALALLYKQRDPEILQTGGTFSVENFIADLLAMMPSETLQRIYAPKRRESSTDERIREEMLRALKILDDLGCLTIRDGTITPLAGLAHFADPLRPINTHDPEVRNTLTRQAGVVWRDAEALTVADRDNDEEVYDIPAIDPEDEA
jgi:chromosome condensin MukBEF MukE localization factor